MATQIFTISESVEVRRHFSLMLVDGDDGITPETGEATGQPQIKKAGEASWTNTEETLNHIGNGHYDVVLSAAELNTFGTFSVRYKSANTAEFQDVGYVQASGEVSLDEIKQMLVKIQQKVNWIEHIMQRQQQHAIQQREVSVT